MYQPLCLCPEIKPLQLETRMIALMHCREQKLTSNTATLACLALSNSALIVRGEKAGANLATLLVSSEGQTALLYPTADATELGPEVARALARPLTLIVPDGSWRQARKVATREPAARNLLRLKLPPGPPSDYRLRHSPHPERLSTFEAMSRALGILEGKEIQAELDLLFLKKVERTMWSRGLLKPEDCKTGIPENALLASRLAGMQAGT